MAVPLSHDIDASPCTALGDALFALADGELGSLCSARAESHAAECARCAARLASARGLKRRLRAIGDAERAPDELRASIMASLRGLRESRTI